MANETDFPPIEYLQRRIIYYKKRRGAIRNWPNDEYFVKRYGKRKITSLSKSAVERIEGRIKEYEDAIQKLKQ